jgi:hypothetical protein
MSANVLGESDQYDAFEDLQARLVQQFPDVPVSLVEAVVQRWIQSFDGARVTLYLPILVERASRDELARSRVTSTKGRPVGLAPAPA